MPSRKWHSKSKSGCMQCKERRMKCDESRPTCRNCARRYSPCIYGADTSGIMPNLHHGLLSIQYQEDAGEEQVALHGHFKRWHKKSKLGCSRCKERRVKCDETTPTCMNCKRVSLDCVYPTPLEGMQPLPASVPTMLAVARLQSELEVMAFEYFHLYSLPTFRKCQPSVLWRYTIGFSAQTNSTLRQIAIALGFQQLVLETGVEDISHLSARHQSEILYGNAIRSLRLTIETMSVIDTPIVTLCCVLLIILESLRGSSADLLLHLRSAVQITLQATQRNNFSWTDEIQDVAALLQNLSLSAWLFATSLSYKGKHALTLQDIDFHSLYDLCPPDQQEDLSLFAVDGLLSKVIQTLRKLMHPDTRPEQHVTLFDQLFRLRAKSAYLESRLPMVQTKSIDRGFIECKLIMQQIFLTRTLEYPHDRQIEARRYTQVLDLLQNSLIQLNSARTREPHLEPPCAFSVATGVMYTLESIIRNAHDQQLKERALSLIKFCPPYEGLWTSKRTFPLYFSKRQTEVEQASTKRRTFAIDAEDKLASAEDCVVLAHGMLERLHLERDNATNISR